MPLDPDCLPSVSPDFQRKAILEAIIASSGSAFTGLTDAELRASPVPVSGTVTATVTGGTVTGTGTAGSQASGVISVQGFGYKGTSTVTRGANITPYSIGDVVGGALTITTIGPANGHIYITDSKFMMNVTAVPTGLSSFTLHLYDATPPSAITDNSPFTLGSGDRASYLGSINLGTPSLVGVGTGTPYVMQTQLNSGFIMPAGTSLFAYLVTSVAYTPAANSETYSLTLKSILV